jgi:hypothetical protein
VRRAAGRYCVFCVPPVVSELPELGLGGVVGERDGAVAEPPALPDGGVAVELRGVVLLPDVPLEPPLSQPTSASVASIAPARSVRLSMEALLTEIFKDRRPPGA